LAAIAVATIFAVLSAPASDAGKGLEARLDQRQERCRHLSDGIDARLCQKQGLKIEISQFKEHQLWRKALLAGELYSF
jgi:hypothetical protein